MSNGILQQYMASQFATGNAFCGDQCVLHQWAAIIPDPEVPGTFREVNFYIEARAEISAVRVDEKGNPVSVTKQPA